MAACSTSATAAARSPTTAWSASWLGRVPRQARLYAHFRRYVERQRHLPSRRRHVGHRPATVYRLGCPNGHIRHAGFDRSDHKQRVLVNDSTTGWSVGASFLAKADPTELDFTATTIGGSTLTTLESLLKPGQSVSGGWQFLATAVIRQAIRPISRLTSARDARWTTCTYGITTEPAGRSTPQPI